MLICLKDLKVIVLCPTVSCVAGWRESPFPLCDEMSLEQELCYAGLKLDINQGSLDDGREGFRNVSV